MNYIDKNLIIERYTNGSMNAAEMQNFHAMLETDAELRSLLHAENVINSTLNGQRAMLESVDHSHTYARFLKSLADSVPQAAATTAAAGTGKAASWLAGVSASTKLTVSTLLLAGGITAGVVLLQPDQPASVTTPQEQPVQQERIPAPAAAPAPELSAPATVQNPNTSTTARPVPARTNNPAASAPATENTGLGTEEGTKQDIPTYQNNDINVSVQGSGKK